MSKDKKLDFSEKKETYIINFLMCLNGGLVASFSYSYASMLATAITGGWVKIFKSIFDFDTEKVIAYSVSAVFFILGILFTIFIKSRANSKRNEHRLAIISMVFCYVSLILSPLYFSEFFRSENGWIYYLLPVLFSSAVQYNTFGYMDGVQCATMFVTNNVRQILIRFISSNGDKKTISQGFLYLFSLLFFTLGLAIGFRYFQASVNIFYLSILISFISFFIEKK